MEKSKLTAYALNEVTETERSEIEAYLALHPEEKRDVEEIKLVSSILKSEMASDLVVPAPELKIKEKSTGLWSFLKSKPLRVVMSLAFIGVISVLVLQKNQQYTRTRLTESDVFQPPIQEQVAKKEAAVSAPKQKSNDSSAGVSLDSADMVLEEAPASAPVADKLSGSAASMPQSVAGRSKAGLKMAEGESKKMKLGYFGGSAMGGGSAGNVAGIAEPEYRGLPQSEEYKAIPENDFILSSKESLSTFSIDVDTASYTNSRRYLTSYNQIPPMDAIRTEEFVNYFDYDYKEPASGHPIAVHMEATRSPWNPDRAIVRVGLKAKDLDLKSRPKSNLVFLIDVSGSMDDENKLPLVKTALKTLTEQLSENDRISMVVYAGQSGVVLDSVSGNQKKKILDAIQKLSSGGGTNGEGGIRKAYEIAQKNYISGGNNRVILASDGDFNVGVTSPADLLKIIKEKSEGGMFLTVLGFGMGNYKDARMEEISNKGQGNYFYIDNAKEADKVFVNQLAGTLYTVAKDVKVQIEFNPKVVHSYRLVGYENRMLSKEDFANDKVDAGEMGAGHSVTALYEIEWAGKPGAKDIPLKYQQKEEKVEKDNSKYSDEILTAKIRYKKPQNSSSEYFDQVLKNNVVALDSASCSTRFAVAVASFSQWMRDSPYLKDFEAEKITGMAENCLSTRDHKDEFKGEFLDLVKKARSIKK